MGGGVYTVGLWRFVCLGLDSCTGCSSHSHLRYCRGAGGGKRVAEEASTGGAFVPVKLSLSPEQKKERVRQTGCAHQTRGFFVLPARKWYFLC